MLDPAGFSKFNPDSTLEPQIFTPIAIKDITEEHKMLLNPMLYGFTLGDKTWGGFAVSKIRDVEWNDSMIDSLVLEPQRKAFIHALVRTHGLDNPGDEVFDDFVHGKGRGLIGVLSGPPGVGKTFTAEAVAEIVRRPLYMISSGELGDEPGSLQLRLARALELGMTWNAVVLIDEADIFLLQRTNDSASRNAITSIFLRELEYYGGILLLTTNRLSSLDQAFHSRVHFTFNYPNLDVEARFVIWRKFVNKARAAAGVTVHLSDDEIRDLAILPLNGRQIKNCVGTSQAVAKENQTPMDASHIRLAVSFIHSKWDDNWETIEAPGIPGDSPGKTREGSGLGGSTRGWLPGYIRRFLNRD